MHAYKKVFLFLSLFAVCAFASDDDDFVDLTSDEAEAFMGTAMAAMLKISYDNDKEETLDTLQSMLRLQKSDVFIAASQNEYDHLGNFVKAHRIYMALPKLDKPKNATSSSEEEESSSSEEDVDEDDTIDIMRGASRMIQNLTSIRLSYYGLEYDDDEEIKEEGYISNEFTVLGDKDHTIYNFTAITTKEEMEKILKQFNGDLTKVYRDVDGKIVKDKSSFSNSNGFVTVGITSAYIPSKKVVEDAIAGFTRIALMYPEKIPKRMTEYLKAKNGDYHYMILTTSDEYSIESDTWFQLQYNDFDDIPDLYIYMKKKNASV